MPQDRIPAITERLCPAALTTTLPSIQPLTTTLLADTTLLKLFTPHPLPYINTVLGLQAFSHDGLRVSHLEVHCPLPYQEIASTAVQVSSHCYQYTVVHW